MTGADLESVYLVGVGAGAVKPGDEEQGPEVKSCVIES